ncbi:type I restriction endonuclease [Anaerolineales bacterium HSG25]|nr:type I restriction endonuclease [Anaerolineales bacterium HSG25]
MISKKELSERDICTKYIQPALEQAGWNRLTQIREEVSFTDGRIFVKGNMSTRGKRKRADYILYYKPNIPIAVIEAKDNNHSMRAGIQQALNYAEILDIPSVYSSNGDGFYEHDRTCTDGVIEKALPLDAFPSPELLWQRYKKYKGIETDEEERISAQDYFFDGSDRAPRYYHSPEEYFFVARVKLGKYRLSNQ